MEKFVKLLRQPIQHALSVGGSERDLLMGAIGAMYGGSSRNFPEGFFAKPLSDLEPVYAKRWKLIEPRLVFK